jgi:tetratricopeptide (TPR) repeat protein
VAAVLLFAIVAAPGFAQQADAVQTLLQANRAFQAGEADKALGLLNSLPQGGINLAQAQNLACRVHFTLQQWDSAVRECQQAVRLDGQNSVDHMWLGRALGEKAGNASFLTAFSLGKQVRIEFETAARLDSRNAEALTDLGEFYAEAPGIVGGGLDKAGEVAAELDRLDPARAHQLRARIADANNDYGTGERELKAAIASAAHPAKYWTTLASFYRHRSRWPEMEWAIHNCISTAQRDSNASVALYDGAGVLIESSRDPALAARMLESYLASPSKTEEAPACEAHLRLARLKKQLGDTAGAQQELTAALQLAHDYKPALDYKL